MTEQNGVGRSNATDELRSMLDERGVKWTSERVGNGVLFTFTKDGRTYSVLARDRAGLEMWSQYLTPEQAIEATLGRSSYTYEQWREISDAVGDAMEYAHERAIEHQDKADPLWNLDEYVNRVLEVAFGSSSCSNSERTTKDTEKDSDGRGECRNVCNSISEFTCSECGFNCDLTSWISLFDGDDGRHRHHHHGIPNFCPNCGREIKED